MSGRDSVSAARWRGALLALSLTACASTQPQQARTDVADLLEDRGGLSDVVVDHTDGEEAERVRQRVDELLAKPLTVEAALQIAMLNNRGLLATFEQLGIAQADLVQAGLLDNPTIGGDLIVSTRGNGLGGGLGLSQSILSAFLIPAKKRVAEAELQRAVLTVSNTALTIVRDVKIAYVEVQAAADERDLQRTLVQTAEVADDLARRLLEAGNLTELDRQLFAADLDHARLELAEARLHLTESREALNRLLGLWGGQVGWRLADPLPEPPPAEVALDDLESLGMSQRLDLSAARFNVDAMQYALELRRRGIVPDIDVGVEAGNEVGDDEGHEWVVGPSLEIELPIFDPGHADLARLGAQLRQAQHLQQQLAIDARSEIRAERAALSTARQRAEYIRDTMLPRLATVSGRALERYNAMLIGAHELLEIRAERVEAQHEWVEARRDYWTARAELEWSVGGRLPSPG